MRRKIYILLGVIGLLVFTQTSIFANTFGTAKGIMPDSPLYSVDIGMEKVQLLTSHNQDQAAKLHLQFSQERLTELDYLTDQSEVSINNVITVSDDYHENINQFNKIVVNKVNSEQELNEDIKPQLEALQLTQNKIVAKINESEQKEVKIIVKTAIKESQQALITAVETVKKPIQEKQQKQDDNNEDSQETTKMVEELDETIENLKTQNEELTQEIIADETELKEANEQKDQEQVDTEEVPIEENLDVTTETDLIEVVTEPVSEENPIWYYSASCDFVSKTPGKDPVCGEDLIPVESLPADNSFFSCYTFDETAGKYVQKLEDVIENIEENNESSNTEDSPEAEDKTNPESTEEPNPVTETETVVSEF